MSDRLFERAIHDWLEDGSDRTPPTAVDAVLFAIKTTPQQRELWLHRRFNPMPTYMRYAAAVAIVAIVGVGALAYNLANPGAGAKQTPGPTTAPTANPAPASVAPGIGAWTTYTSEVYGLTYGYPSEWKIDDVATRKWQAGDPRSTENAPYADIFVTRDNEIGVLVWQRPAGTGDITSRDGLAAWAAANECDPAINACATVSGVAVPMCSGKVACLPAILVPLSDSVTAFFGDPEKDLITIVSIARPDSFPGAAQYGGSLELLKSILTTMDVWTPKPGQA